MRALNLLLPEKDESVIDDLSVKTRSISIYDRRIFEHEHLFDFRLRDMLESKGFSLNLVYTADFVTNHSGGLKKAGSDVDTHISYLANTDLIVELDTEKAGLWNGLENFTDIFLTTMALLLQKTI